MARCPIATWHSLGDNPTHQPLMSKYDGIVLHTAVGSLISTYGYFEHANGEGYIGTESHFIVGAYGEKWQITDTARTADANLDGNSRLLSIETADSYPPFPKWTGEDVPAWRPEQIEALAQIIAWAAKEHDFPIVRMANSLPSTRGVGYHRLGIDPWRIDGGEHWSTSGGKVCPGDRRVAQVDQVIVRAQAIAGQGDPWPHRGETSPAVGVMAAKLDLAGYYPGKRRDREDFFGYYTTEAIKNLQRSFDDTKADPDGVIGPKTWAHIEALPDKPPPPHKSPLADAWQRATGDAVHAGEAFIAAHPKMPAYAALLRQQQAEWRAIYNLNH